MPFAVVVDAGSRPTPQIVSPRKVVRQARATGNPNASRAAAATVPRITVDQSRLEFERRRKGGGIEFRFQTGQLQLRLHQSTYIANDLSECTQGVWREHEQDHVVDNQQIMRQMEAKIRANQRLQTIFFSPLWRPMKRFDAIQNRIRTNVAGIFTGLVRDAVQARDTAAEYDRIQRAIERECPAG